MCGIFFSVARGGPSWPDDAAVDALKARGPDSYKVLNVTLPDPPPGNLYLTFASSVLALRGDRIQEQPLRDPSSGSILCWNGEAWKVDGVNVQGNDSVQIWQRLLEASHSSDEHEHKTILQVLSNITGPFAFVFYSALSATVYYGRDSLGRRSLLMDHCDEQSLTLSSTGISNLRSFSGEVSTAAVHYLSLKQKDVTLGDLPWLNASPPINKSLPSHVPATTPSPSSVEECIQYLKSALQCRVMDIPDLSHGPRPQNSAKVAILFSGGLDCTLLARLTHDILPRNEPVDLLNVAFENPRSITANGNLPGSPYETCPDRVTGRSSFSELCQVCPERTWKFVAIDVPYSESLAHRPTVIRLMYPHNTEMDLSIATALYFAARGQGDVLENRSGLWTETRKSFSTARVLLSGLGADELYAGYYRHSAAFARGDLSDLVDELELDFSRMGSRNLGRDDRVMSHWGKEVRYPYLDEDFVRLSLSLPVWEKSGFRPGKRIPKHYGRIDRVEKPEDLEPAKLLLRLAMWKLNMKTAASERKRAIQFGARTAKMNAGQGRMKGTDVLV
ncbi:uncharacterized protein Z518_05376 [Rhinocladiella mackenziei CBS 650.93]|uniref:Glutamine amidotransferase type-2 domain-containing protein n=1 Tax=Rhinocladiella mackenziei CBS 650.93 TaxID=1442369 RepID=A0A0D2IN27_9EURO|nr:uncharacterized protein Z518_05376 [Rhinocladiella mackenziei CBS 650.93]KIX04506.1 hypothetical protein Z518_05376 [Rhinocladiella mackenziei CBS 650.93]